MTATVTGGTSPWGAVYDSSKNEVFVSNWGSNTVSVISDSNNAVTATVPVEKNPWGLAYDPAKGEIFVANSGGNTVSVISDSS